MFGELKTVHWVSKINLSKNREGEIRSCFVDTPIEFHYLSDLSEFNVLIETFQQKRLEDENKNAQKQ